LIVCCFLVDQDYHSDSKENSSEQANTGVLRGPLPKPRRADHLPRQDALLEVSTLSVSSYAAVDDGHGARDTHTSRADVLALVVDTGSGTSSKLVTPAASTSLLLQSVQPTLITASTFDSDSKVVSQLPAWSEPARASIVEQSPAPVRQTATAVTVMQTETGTPAGSSQRPSPSAPALDGSPRHSQKGVTTPKVLTPTAPSAARFDTKSWAAAVPTSPAVMGGALAEKSPSMRSLRSAVALSPAAGARSGSAQSGAPTASIPISSSRISLLSAASIASGSGATAKPTPSHPTDSVAPAQLSDASALRPAVDDQEAVLPQQIYQQQQEQQEEGTVIALRRGICT